MPLKRIKQKNWKYLVNRRESLFMTSITSNSPRYFKKITGISEKLMDRVHFSDGDVFYNEKELKDMNQVFNNGGYKLFLSFRDSTVKYVKELDRVAREIEKINCSQLTKAELNKWINKFLKVAIYAHNFLAPIAAIDKILAQVILKELHGEDEEKKQEWLKILTFPIKENEHAKEERSFYNLLLAYKRKDENFDKLLKQHLRKFRWIGARLYYWHNYWTEEIIRERMDDFVKQNKDPKEELKRLDYARVEMKGKMDRLLIELNIKKSSDLYKLIQLSKEYVYLRTWRTDTIYGSGYKVRELFYEVARRI